MQLKVRFLDWSAGVPSAMLNQKTADRIGLHTKDRISLRTIGKRTRELSTILDTIKGIIRENEIGVSKELREQLKLRKGQKVDVNLATPPKSMAYIKKKLNNKKLSAKEINEIIKDVVENALSESEIALFISAMYKNGMNKRETIALIKAIEKSGNQIRLRNKYVVDKHSIGGVPGNRTTPVVVSICAAAGLTMPKTSSRAITSAAGTADVIEAIARVEFTVKELKKIIQKTGACMVWGGALGMVPADSKIIKIEKMLKIDPESQLVASIISKKLAVGSKYILIDIPYGKGAKVDKKKALKLKKRFESLGKYFNRKLKCVLTDGSQPIGRGVGPVPELVDVIDILDPKKQGPLDLEEKSVFLAGELLEMTGKTEKGKGISYARELLLTGKAFEKFKEIIKAQEGNLDKMKKAKFEKNITAKKTGKIKSIENKKISSLAIITGCPLEKSAGLKLWVMKNQKVKKRETIITIYSNSKSRLNEAVKYFNEEKPVNIN